MLKIIIKLFRLLAVILFILLLSIFLYQKGWLKKHPLQNQIQLIQDKEIANLQDLLNSFKEDKDLNLELSELSTSAGQQIKSTAEKAIEAGKFAQEFMSESIQSNEESEKNLGEKAFEYGQYIYCKAVVDDWEQKLDENEASTESSLKEAKEEDKLD
jgi:hypothetical protein